MILTQTGTGTITGSWLGHPCSPTCQDFTSISGSVVGNSVTIVATVPFTVTLTGAIAADGSMSGNWADGAGGLGRAGAWSTTSGAATLVSVVLACEFRPRSVSHGPGGRIGDLQQLLPAARTISS